MPKTSSNPSKPADYMSEFGEEFMLKDLLPALVFICGCARGADWGISVTELDGKTVLLAHSIPEAVHSTLISPSLYNLDSGEVINYEIRVPEGETLRMYSVK